MAVLHPGRREGSRGGVELPLREAIGRLLGQYRAELGEVPLGFEVIGAPVAGPKDSVRIHPGYCFCDHQMVRELRTGTGPGDFCLVAGDIVAAAIGMHTGMPLAATQTASRVAGAPFCEFRIGPCADATSAKVHQAFCAALGSMTAGHAA